MLAGSTGSAMLRASIPNDLGLVGQTSTRRALVPDPQAGNALGAAVSGAATAVVGR